MYHDILQSLPFSVFLGWAVSVSDAQLGDSRLDLKKLHGIGGSVKKMARGWKLEYR